MKRKSKLIEETQLTPRVSSERKPQSLRRKSVSIPNKIFILDTNVVLHDAACIRHFQEHDIVLPLAVIEELDHFKRGNHTINLNAREFARALDALVGDGLFNGGISLGKGSGKLSIALQDMMPKEVKTHFREDNADHRVLGVAYSYAQQYAGKRPVILVTKDVNLRMKAKALNIPAEDYTTDQVANIDELYTGRDFLEGVDDHFLAQLFEPPYQTNAYELLNAKTELVPNKYFILRNGKRSALGYYHAETNALMKIDKMPMYGILPRNAEQSFAVHALSNPEIPLVSITGKAGTGKTLLALASALEMRKRYKQIYIARPVVPLANKDIGFLPGDVESKLGPYMQPLWDNLKVIQNQFSETEKQYSIISQMIKDEKLVIEPLSYIRGRSLQNIYFIIDEAQNLTPHEMKTIVTRAGEGSKIVFTGDIYQIDHPYLDSQSNGLSYLIDHFKGQRLYAHVTLEKGERSVLAELASNLL